MLFTVVSRFYINFAGDPPRLIHINKKLRSSIVKRQLLITLESISKYQAEIKSAGQIPLNWTGIAIFSRSLSGFLYVDVTTRGRAQTSLSENVPWLGDTMNFTTLPGSNLKMKFKAVLT